VVLEPRTGEYTLRHGKSFEVIAEGDLLLPLEVELIDDRLVVYAFDSAGALLRIFQDGTELLTSECYGNVCAVGRKNRRFAGL